MRRVNHRRSGSGERSIVYVHGLGESGLCFEAFVLHPALAGATHVVPDLPGYGRSPWPAVPMSLDAVADHLIAWLAAERIDRPVIVGHSMGGVLGLLVAERAPERVAALVDVEGNVSLGDCTFSGKAAALSREQLIDGGFDRLREEMLDGAGGDRALRGYYASLRFADPATYHQHAVDLVDISRGETIAGRLAALAVPVVYVAGRAGGVCARSLELLTAAGVSWIGIDGAGHWPYIDRPDDVAAIVRSSLDRATARAETPR
jgi:pimeloyl-ACP methyl ester carboxylesterase